MRAGALLAVVIAGCSYDRPPLALEVDAMAVDARVDSLDGCVEDLECASGVCAADMCVDPADIAYVSVSGTATTSCTQTDPCSTVTRALSLQPSRHWIMVAPGTYTQAVTFTNVATTVVGQSTSEGSRPVFNTGSSTALAVSGSTVEFRNLELRSPLSCTSSPATRLVGIVSIGVTNDAINARDCALTVTRSQVRDSRQTGVTVLRGSLAMSGSLVRGNLRGGVEVRNADSATITGSMLVRNGSITTGGVTGSSFGGADLEATQLRFDGNTIADNLAASNFNAAVVCSGSVEARYRNNLVTSESSFSTMCQFVDSGFSGIVFPPLGNNTLLSNVAYTADYHLAQPLRSTDTTLVTDLDFDGQPRPLGELDFGADELP